MFYQAQYGVIAHADDGGECFEMVGKARLALAAQGGAGVGEAHGFDDVRGGDVVPFVAQEGGGAPYPAHAVVVGMRPEVGVPAGGGQPRAVAAFQAQAAVGPGYPGAIDFDFGQAFEQGVVVLGGGFRGKRRHVPGAADDGDAPVGFFRLAQGFAHPCFTQGVARVSVAAGFAQGADGLGNGGEYFRAVATLLNQCFPEGFAVGQAGDGGEFVEGIAVPGLFGGVFVFCFAPVFAVDFIVFGSCVFSGVFIAVVGRFFFIKAVRQRQIAKLQGNARLRGVAHRLPFRREGGEGVVNRLLRCVRTVGEQGDRRLHVGFGSEREQCVGLRRPFEQDAIGLEIAQGGYEVAGGTRAVVADAKESGGHGAVFMPCRARRGRGLASRRAV